MNVNEPIIGLTGRCTINRQLIKQLGQINKINEPNFKNVA